MKYTHTLTDVLGNKTRIRTYLHSNGSPFLEIFDDGNKPIILQLVPHGLDCIIKNLQAVRDELTAARDQAFAEFEV